MLWIIAIVNLIYAPFLFFLRNPPGKEEKQVGLLASLGFLCVCGGGGVLGGGENMGEGRLRALLFLLNSVLSLFLAALAIKGNNRVSTSLILRAVVVLRWLLYNVA